MPPATPLSWDHLPYSPVRSRRAVLRLMGHAGALVALPAGLSAGLASWPAAAQSTAPAFPDRRLVVVMLRGALDALAAVPATGDPHWNSLRPASAASTSAADGTPARALQFPFALHGGLKTLHHWYTQKELLVLHAIASPYRERSHFDAQQMLEAGTDKPFALNTGWLGRALQQQGLGGVAMESALPLGLRGAERASTWAPARQGQDPGEDTLQRLQRLYATDPAMARAWNLAQTQNSQTMARGEPNDMRTAAPAGANRSNPWADLLRQAGQMLARPDGPRVAWLDTDGWDTHTQQANRLGRLLPQLDEALAALRTSLGPVWATTSVLVMTEFGRTAVPNGTGGTDHGTGGVAFLAGGAVAGGRVQADWPGLSESQLLTKRDLRPTQDIRALLASTVQWQFGLTPAQIARDIVPGVQPMRTPLWQS